MESFREMLSSYMCALDPATSFFSGLETFFDLSSTIRPTVDAMELTLKQIPVNLTFGFVQTRDRQKL